MDEPCDVIPNNFRSLNSLEKCYIRFINTTDRSVDVFWINYSGVLVNYRLLNKGRYVDVSTYKTHPWIVKDTATKDMMLINGTYFYQPKTSREIFEEKYPGNTIPEHHEVRTRAFISVPVYSLRYACLLTLRNHLSSTEDVDELVLPRNLLEDLKKAISKRNRECSMETLKY